MGSGCCLHAGWLLSEGLAIKERETNSLKIRPALIELSAFGKQEGACKAWVDRAD